MQELIKRLEVAQRSLPEIDVMTMGAICETEEELRQHVENCEWRVQRRAEKK